MLKYRRCILFAVAAGLVAAAFVADKRPEVDHELRPAVANKRELAPLATASAGNVERTTVEPEQTDPNVTRKYAALLDSLAPIARDELQAVLVARESTDATHFTEIAALERRISLLLREDEYRLYERLRESEGEQARLRVFAQRLASTEPLTAQQQRELLVTKLEHLQELQALELQASVPRADRGAMENSYARDIAVQGIRHYEQVFLERMRSVLTQEQWTALEEFATAERAQHLQPLDPVTDSFP